MTKQQFETTDDFKNFIDLMAVYSDAKNRIVEIEMDATGQLLELIDDKRGEYAELQKALTQSEAALEVIARKHPEWFADKRSVKTIYGGVQFRKSSKLEIKNEELSVLLIKQNPDLDDAEYLRATQVLNIEALEKLADDQLKKLRIERISDDKFTVKEAKIDLGKAVKEAVSKEAA